MAFISFTCYTPQAEYRHCHFIGPDLESCLSTLTALVNAGWHLDSVQLRTDSSKKVMGLPVAAFDGESFTEPLGELQQQWTTLLYVA